MEAETIHSQRLVVGINAETNKMLVRLRYILEEQNVSTLRISYSEVVRRAIKEMAARYNIE
jgi:hypothetical protein